MQRVRIYNDGQPGYMTQVTDVLTHEVLERVVRVDLLLVVEEKCPTVVLHVAFPVIDIIADAEIRNVCPCCGKEVEQPK